MNYAVAFKRWGLSKLLEKIQGPYFVIGDNAYTQTGSVMTPFNKAQVAGRPERDAYNFYLSQCRIRVEMAFGLLVNKWRILKSPLCVSLSRCSAVISACVRLHNFCIDERQSNGAVSTQTMLNDVRQSNPGNPDISYTETIVSADQPEPADPVNVVGEAARQALVDMIASRNLHRPARNLARQAREQAESGQE